MFVAEVDDQVVGYIHIERYSLLYFEDMGNILGLAIAKNYRKQGYGKELMKKAENWACENDIKMLRLNSGMGRKERSKRKVIRRKQRG